MSIAKQKLNTTSTLLAQHFSILRELKAMCESLKENLQKTPNGQFNLEEAWNCFDQLMDILEAGCDFLNFPISI
jgi:hypothetical protein